MSGAAIQDDEVQTEDIKALLRELADVNANGDRVNPSFDGPHPPSTTRRSGNKLHSQRSSSRISTAPIDDHLNPFISKEKGQSLLMNYTAYETPVDYEGNPAARRVITPLGIRLSPIKSSQVEESQNHQQVQKEVSERKTVPSAPPSSSRLKAHSARPPFKSLNPLPVRQWDVLVPEGGTDVLLPIELRKREVEVKKEPEVMCDIPDEVCEIPCPDSNQSKPELTPVRETNFLPVMCAQYLDPSGLTPSARWGHTLTALGNGKLYLFGGMEKDGEVSNVLAEFDTSSCTWDPAYVMKGIPPTARYYHAACSYDNRFLIICGGNTSSSAAPVGIDIYSYDTYLHEWDCLWRGDSKREKNEPPLRYGHTVISQGDKLYLLGGKSSISPHLQKDTRPADTQMDIFVFSLTSRKWKKKIRIGKGSEENPTLGGPLPRAHHASCLLGDSLFVHGGAALGKEKEILADVWRFDLKQGKQWECVHPGGSADAFPREKHALYACGEALLVLGGCTQSPFNDRIAYKFNTAVAVLPLLGRESLCWLPMSMGNSTILAANKMAFGSTMSGGFMYVVGGMCNSEISSSAMIRFLAADGDTSTAPQEVQMFNIGSIRGMMQRLQRNPTYPHDSYVVPGSFSGGKSTECIQTQRFGCYHALLQVRAPLFLKDLKECRQETILGFQGSLSCGPDASLDTPASVVEDSIDAILFGSEKLKHASSATPQPNGRHSGAAGCDAVRYGFTMYYCEGNSRVKGLSSPMTASQLECFMDYVYWGGLRSEFKVLLEPDEEDLENQNAQRREKERLREVIRGLRGASNVYRLEELGDLCDALLQKDREKISISRVRASKRLKSDLVSLLESGEGATMTLLFTDPHTKKQMSTAVHPFLLTAASSFFSDLLRPIIKGGKTRFSIENICATLSNSASVESLPLATSKRSILVGPISIPSLAVRNILNYLYTLELSVKGGSALSTMMGARSLQLPLLQSYCESIVACEEVNYETCCSFYYLARQHSAPLLEEMALLTAVSGFSEVSNSAGFKSLPDNEKNNILALVNEVGSGGWITPPKLKTELKSAEAYKRQWNSFQYLPQ